MMMMMIIIIIIIIIMIIIIINITISEVGIMIKKESQKILQYTRKIPYSACGM